MQVWPLPPLVGYNGTLDAEEWAGGGGCLPLVSLALNSEPLMTLQEVKAIGWKCLAALSDGAFHARVLRARAPPLLRLPKRTPLMALLLSEWPTALAASRAAPLVAVAGASGRVVLASHPAGRPAPRRRRRLRPAELALHCHTVARSTSPEARSTPPTTRSPSGASPLG